MAFSKEKLIRFRLHQEARLRTQSSIMKPGRFLSSFFLKLTKSLANDSKDRSTGHQLSSSSHQHFFREINLPLNCLDNFFIALWTIECVGKLISLLTLSSTFGFSGASRTVYSEELT